jgi:hypothetical protein
MAQSVTARAAARGFPVWDYGGQTGQGALPDSTARPATAGLPVAPWRDPNSDPGSVPAVLPPPQEYQLGLTMWGLPAAANPDNTPRTHAAPMADDARLAAGEDDGTHAPVFTGVAERQPQTSGHMRQGRTGGQGSTADTLQPLTGQIRAQAGYDAVQGYGGGGPGPGGVNDPQGPATDLTTFGGEVYRGSAGTFVSAGEVPFLTAGADQFIPSVSGAPEFPGYMPTWDAPTSSVSAQDVTGVDTPAQGPPAGQGPPAYAATFWN